MQVKTWLQRLTDESNLWFNAVKAEDEENFENAVSYYMQDALKCINQRSLVRAALSCSCAANCLTKLGAFSPARMLYSEAGGIYMENSKAVMSESIREALWSLQEAFENYTLAGDGAADAVRARYVALASRMSPFSKTNKATNDLESRKAELPKPDLKQETKIHNQLSREIQDFVNARNSSRVEIAPFDSNYVMKSIDLNGGSKLDEKSIAS